MIEKICSKLFDLLAASPTLYAGGSAFGTAWLGVKREPPDGAARAGWVNLYDKPYEIDGGGHRPGVYLGMKAFEVDDRQDFPVVSSSGHIDYRIMTVPIVICVQAADKNTARKQRNQLRNNIRKILFPNLVVSGYWYNLTMPGSTGSGIPERVWTTATGGGDQQVAEAVCGLPVVLQYSWNASADA
jgi:hypothetical protein